MRSPIAWRGGKSKIAQKIVDIFPDHTCYCEVFAGGAWVFFKKSPSKVEVINDINQDLITFYRVLQYHIEEFVKILQYQIHSRDEFNRIVNTPSETLTDIWRAVKFFYVNRYCFASRHDPPIFGSSVQHRTTISQESIGKLIKNAHDRLKFACVENLNYSDIINKYDREETLFYVDPPYYGHEGNYGKSIFCSDDFSNLSKILSKIKGKFVFSINDVPEIRELFSGMVFSSIKTQYSANIKHNKNISELLITNFDLSTTLL